MVKKVARWRKEGREPVHELVEKQPSVWRHPDFMKFWTADLISQFGTQITFLALPLIAITTLGSSVFEVGVLQTVEWLPVALISLPAGVWIDRRRRRPIMIACDLGRALFLLLIPIAFVLDVLSIWLLYLVAFSVGALTVCFDLAHRSYLPSLLDREQLVAGNSALEIEASAARVAGPGLAGGAIGLLTAPWAIVLDVASFFGSTLLLVRIRQPEPLPLPQKDVGSGRSSFKEGIGEGLRYVRGHWLLAPLAVNGALANLGLAIIEGVFVVYMVRRLGLTAAQIGLVFAVANVGLLIGASLAGTVARRAGIGPTLAVSSSMQGMGLLLLPLAPMAPLPLLIAGQLLRSLGIVVYNINQRSLRQAMVPARLQGRTNATLRFIVWGTIPVGNLAGGAIASLAGFAPALWLGAAIGVSAVLPVALSSVRTLRDMPAREG